MLSEIKGLAEQGYAYALEYGEEVSKEFFWQILMTLNSLDPDALEGAGQTGRTYNKVRNKEDVRIVAYYLSEYGHEDIFSGQHLTQKEGIKMAADCLGVKANTLKNERDMYDTHTGSTRKGWGAPLNADQQFIMEVMKSISRDEAREKVRRILGLAESSQVILD